MVGVEPWDLLDLGIERMRPAKDLAEPQELAKEMQIAPRKARIKQADLLTDEMVRQARHGDAKPHWPQTK